MCSPTAGCCGRWNEAIPVCSDVSLLGGLACESLGSFDGVAVVSSDWVYVSSTFSWVEGPGSLSIEVGVCGALASVLFSFVVCETSGDVVCRPGLDDV